MFCLFFPRVWSSPFLRAVKEDSEKLCAPPRREVEQRCRGEGEKGWEMLDSVAALREQAAVSRLIRSGHKAAMLVFLAGGFTLWTLRDRSRGALNGEEEC
ncbi:hypothetical protein NQZ68_011426 [Dissostichus eleginoides]|nr:hypothetical protein NQZ68_011426 [Dissostichus eleginoides]